MQDPAQPPIDLSECEREPLHIPGAIQPHGVLIAFALPGWTVAQISSNAAAVLGLSSAEALIGASVQAVLPPITIHDIRNALQAASITGFAERLMGVGIGPAAAPVPGRYEALVHASGPFAVVELIPLEGADTTRVDPTSLVKTIADRLRRAPSLQAFLTLAARQIRAVTGYDRVMIYRFLGDSSGEVVAEALRSGMPPFLHLRYPASDIPAQARALFLRQRLRMIPDVAYQPVPILPRTGDQRPLDLSLSSLRNVSPFHIQYLHNMGSAATLTVSIMEGERLWGLVACHHQTPRRISGTTAAAVELLAEVLSSQVEAKMRRDEAIATAQGRAAQDAVLDALDPARTLFETMTAARDLLRVVIAHDGFAVVDEGKIELEGMTPPKEAFAELLAFLAGRPSDEVFTTHHLSDYLPGAAAYASATSGLMALPLSRTTRDCLILFRREVVQTVAWGGDPRKPVATDDGGRAIGPRASFEAWQEIVRNTSIPWTSAEAAAAERLRVGLLDVLLRRADTIDRARRSAQESQLLLVAELNHRVKNVLAVVRSLVGQSARDAVSIDAFRADLQHRLSALALAHDQLTLSHWNAAPLRTLIEAEAAVWLGAEGERLSVAGPSVVVAARAYQTLALVLHELMTNAAKHGALSIAGGHLSTSWQLRPGGDLVLVWKETGGPPVKAPARRGFGSIVIEQSIPFELRGEAALEYRAEGLLARFIIPAEFVREETVLPILQVKGTGLRADLRGKSLLLVEDSMMIALDAQTMLQSCGAEVELAATTSDARRAIRLNRFDAAILDINLYTETSFAIAADLQEQQIPFVFATGYGENIAMPDRFKKVQIISKPYAADAVRAALAA